VSVELTKECGYDSLTLYDGQPHLSPVEHTCYLPVNYYLPEFVYLSTWTIRYNDMNSVPHVWLRMLLRFPDSVWRTLGSVSSHSSLTHLSSTCALSTFIAYLCTILSARTIGCSVEVCSETVWRTDDQWQCSGGTFVRQPHFTKVTSYDDLSCFISSWQIFYTVFKSISCSPSTRFKPTRKAWRGPVDFVSIKITCYCSIRRNRSQWRMYD